MNIFIPTSIGELFDKITVLQIKQDLIKNEQKLANVNTELNQLLKIAASIDIDSANKSEMEPVLLSLVTELKCLNVDIWNGVDELHSFENNGIFSGEEFSAAARKVYLVNDLRAEVKRKINNMFESEIIEEKYYSAEENI